MERFPASGQIAAVALTTAALAGALPRLAEHIQSVSRQLNELDGQLGDGDLGVTLEAGTRALAELAPALPEDLGQALMACAQAWSRVSSSSFGTLVATALMSAAKATRGETAVEWDRVPALLDGARDAMVARGKASLGDKTVLDALDAAARGAAERSGPAAMLAGARAGVAAALERLRPEPAKIGRARIFAERSIGMDDPGMVALLELLRGLGPPR